MLKVEDLSIEILGESSSETVVYDFDLDIKEGDMIGLVGESGSGKTLTALSIAGLLRRHDMKKNGHIYFEDMDLLNCSRKDLRKVQGAKIGVIFQEPMTSLNPVKKIGWQIEENLCLHTSMNKEERYQRTIEMLADVELDNPEEIYHKYPHQLSGGMRQRVMIASAMILNPKLLIADEPTTALDVTIQAQIVKLLKKINQEKHTAILFISHDLSLVKQLCHKVLVMQDGRVVEQGLVSDIFTKPEKEYTKILINAIPKCIKKKGGNS